MLIFTLFAFHYLGTAHVVSIVVQGKTSTIKSYNPEWKEVLIFTDMFPPLCNRIKIQLCDSDLTGEDAIATHFIQLSHIMDPGGDTEGTHPPPMSKLLCNLVQNTIRYDRRV